MKLDDVRLGATVRCAVTGQIGTVVCIQPAHRLGLEVGMPDMVFVEIEPDAGGIIRDASSLEPVVAS